MSRAMHDELIVRRQLARTARGLARAARRNAACAPDGFV